MLGDVGAAFLGRFKALTEVQGQTVPAILSGKDVLVASATASGKTEAIMAPLVARLQRLNLPEEKRGIVILVVAPTRALVNDLYGRLQWPLLHSDWQCGRQTSDHRDKGRRPHVLITTPESFDSMLCHDVKMRNGLPVDHLLSTVKAVFLDEAHLYENSARGDHVAWLVARLKRLKKYAFRQGWVSSEDIQVCAGSATISQTSSLAERLLGALASVVRVGGDREIEMYCPGPPRQWLRIRSSAGLNPIRAALDSILGFQGKIADLIWDAIENGAQDGLRKMLIFVPSRRECDLLSTELKEVLGDRRNVYVSGHHGSLDRAQREEAEQKFAECRDAVLVATSTLEVGIDIGDVDIIVLIGAPPDTSALLQRIGRGGRRSGLIKILPIPKHRIDCAAMSSMLLYAGQGILETAPPCKRWGVFVQQVISLIMQSGRRGRKVNDVLELAEAVWGDSAINTAKAVLEHLVNEELLIQNRDRLFLGEKFSDGVDKYRAYYHCNFEAEGPTVDVVDNLTHQTIGKVALEAFKTKDLAIGGATVDVVHGGEQILVSRRKGQASNTFQYNARRPIVTKSYAEHARRGLGFGENETVIYKSGEFCPIWFHFGGELYEHVLMQVFKPKVDRSLAGIALQGDVGESDLRDLLSSETLIREVVDDLTDGVGVQVGAGRFHTYLPPAVKAEVIASIFDIEGFIHWATTRTVIVASPGSNRWRKIRSLLPSK